jgi:phosphopentomutase
MKRIIIIVLDGVGVGALPDAHEYTDEGSNSLGNGARTIGGATLPHLGELGLGNLTEISGVPKVKNARGAYGKMAEASKGKDTITGHWEMMGVIRKNPWPVYPHGFPADVIAKVESATGRKVIGNYPASGTEIIKELGDEHVATGKLIVYTSADSVFQIAAHESIIPIEELYSICLKARKMLTNEHQVGRVIARPFIGKSGDYKRTPRRRDWAIEPPREMILTALTSAGYTVSSVGKIDDIFCMQGITKSYHTTNNETSLSETIRLLKNKTNGLIFTNLIDFDQIYGHRRDAAGYMQAMKSFDEWLPRIAEAMSPDDICIITSDHGVDPTYKGTDHTREYVPLLVFGKPIKSNIHLGVRQSFADIGATVAEHFELRLPENGSSFLRQIIQ